MRVLLLFTFLFPLWAGAKTIPRLDPLNPVALCERFLLEKDKARCVKEAESLDLDWYAATICNLIENDEQFLQCWAEMDGKVFPPSDLVKCSEEMPDEERRECLRQVRNVTPKNNRMPSSLPESTPRNASPFQPL